MKIEELLKNIPSKEDIAGALGLQYGSTSPDTLAMLGIFGTGMLLGAGLALLVAPKAGRELRDELAGRFNDLREELSHGERHSAAHHSTTPPLI